MRREPRAISRQAARRLVVTKQRLGGAAPPPASSESILSVVRDLAFVQWDPISIVAPSHELALWARLPSFRPPMLQRLLWDDKRLFEHWMPIASLVLTEDYPLYASLMRRYPESLSGSWGSQRDHARRFLRQHAALRRKILRQLRGGPLTVGQFADHSRTKGRRVEWAPTSDLQQLLYHLLMRGEVMVVGHEGNQNLWGLTGPFLPAWADRKPWTPKRTEQEAAQRAIRALGTATPAEINYYFVRGCYLDLPVTLATLEREGSIHRVVVEGAGPREQRYVHDQDVELLESLDSETWEPRLALLPPFDNMIWSQARALRLFEFNYVREQFLPPEKRRFGTYVLPILWGDRLIGRLDPRYDRTTRTLSINSVHAEPGAPTDRETGDALAHTIVGLGEFLGAARIVYGRRVPRAWAPALRPGRGA